MFISFEGTEGSGKSTQARLLADALTAAGHSVCTVREPGGTPTGEAIREILLHGGEMGLSAWTEALLFASSRAQLVREVLRPRLAQGDLVICDRYLDSSLAYQGGGRELGVDRVRAANAPAIDGLLPRRSYLLDLPWEEARERMKARGRGDDRIESEPRAFHERVRAAYLDLAVDDERFLVLDADDAVESIHRRILSDALGLLEGA